MNPIEKCVSIMMSEVRPGRSGWRQRAETKIRKEVTDRWRQWCIAEDHRVRQERIKANFAEANRLATIMFRNPHGRSYFGSGGAWAKKPITENCEVAEYGDNGFVYGPVAWRVIDKTLPASIVLHGGDCIGRNGRQWTNEAHWCPQQGWYDCSGTVLYW
jgi:hypothetical protein